jgi:superfamily II DNA or RNA helicase
MKKDTIQSGALDAIADRSRAGVNISMGVGKTLLAIKHMTKRYTDISKFLVVAPKRSIFTSWIDEINKNSEYKFLEDHITFSTYRSLAKQDTDYDVIYLDECHSLKATHNEYLKEFIANGGTTIGLTGTYPSKATSEKGKMCNYYCPLVYTYTVDDAVDDNILNDYKIFVHSINLNDKGGLIKSGKYGEYETAETKDYIYWSNQIAKAMDGRQQQMTRIMRMQALRKYVSKENYALKLFQDSNEKTIVFANTQDQADRLCEYSVHSKNSKSDEYLKMFKDDFILKLSAVEQLSEGVTIPNLKKGIIMHAYGNNRKASQKIGRLLRLNPNEESEVHILCYADTVDKDWTENALKGFNQDKITWL